MHPTMSWQRHSLAVIWQDSQGAPCTASLTLALVAVSVQQVVLGIAALQFSLGIWHVAG